MSEPAHSSTVHATLTRIAQYVVVRNSQTGLVCWPKPKQKREEPLATKQDTTRTTKEPEEIEKKTKLRGATNDVVPACRHTSRAPRPHTAETMSGYLQRQTASTIWARVVIEMDEAYPFWTAGHLPLKRNARFTSEATTL